MNDAERTHNLPQVGGSGGGAAPVAPPHPLDGSWHLHADGRSYGPYTGHEIKRYVEEGRITGSTSVVPVGDESWRPAADDPVLRGLFPERRTAPPSLSTSGEKVTAGEGATIVQVTNNLAPSGERSFILDGPAAPKSAGVALLLSLLVAGLGQIYNGQAGKGIGMFVLMIALWFVFLGWVVWIWSAVDAYQTAKAMNLRYMRLLANR